MQNIIEKIENLERSHAKIDQNIILQKKIKLGLRNPDGSGVVAGITSVGRVVGYTKKEEDGKTLVLPTDGKLYYSGFDVEDITKNMETEDRFGFTEIVYLLLTGELPNSNDLLEFSRIISSNMQLNDLEKQNVIRRNSNNNYNVMNALRTSVSALSEFDENPDSTESNHIILQCISIIAKFPSIIANNYRKKVGQPFIQAKKELSFAENFLYMLHGKEAALDIAHLFDLMLILHAEHGGGNNSTFTVRVISSTAANTYAAILGGVAALGGPLHGGANEDVMRMMDEIKTNVKDWEDDKEINEYLDKMIDKKVGDKSGKIYGIGHAVYTISDPRALIIEKKVEELAKKTGKMDEFNLCKKVEKISSKLILEKKGKTVSANVDFYSGFIYSAMNIPRELFTPIFAMARVAGWCAHRIEELRQGKLIRPAYISSILDKKDYIPLMKRS